MTALRLEDAHRFAASLYVQHAHRRDGIAISSQFVAIPRSELDRHIPMGCLHFLMAPTRNICAGFLVILRIAFRHFAVCRDAL